MTPEATPKEALYIETGLLDIETIMEIKRLNMMARLNRNKSKMMTAILANPECKWMKKTRQVMNKYRIEHEELEGSMEEAKKCHTSSNIYKLPQKDDKGQRRKVQAQILPKWEIRLGT